MFRDLDSFHGYGFQLLGDTFHYNVLGVARVGAVGAVIVVGWMGVVRRGAVSDGVKRGEVAGQDGGMG